MKAKPYVLSVTAVSKIKTNVLIRTWTPATVWFHLHHATYTFNHYIKIKNNFHMNFFFNHSHFSVLHICSPVRTVCHQSYPATLAPPPRNTVSCITFLRFAIVELKLTTFFLLCILKWDIQITSHMPNVALVNFIIMWLCFDPNIFEDLSSKWTQTG